MSLNPQSVFCAATLANLEEAGYAVMILTEGLEKEEFLRSRLTAAEVSRHLQVFIHALDMLPPDWTAAIPELDLEGWHGIARQLQQSAPEQREALWFAASAQLPATLLWLKHYRQSQPELFNF